MALNALPLTESALTGSVSQITECLSAALQTMRANHPVSILDVSPEAEPTLALGRWMRQLSRKVRLMSFDWQAKKSREQFVGSPDVMVEKGALPGLHFSNASFDFVVGIDPLAHLAAGLRLRALHELTRVAMRMVVVSEPTAGLSEGELNDLLVQTPHCEGRVERGQERQLVSLTNRLSLGSKR